MPVSFAIQAGALRTNPNSGPDGIGVQADHAYTLEARAEVQAVCFDTTQITSKTNRSSPKPGDPCHPLAAGAHAPCIAFPAQLSGTQCASSENVSPSLGALNPTAVAFERAVRRLTPRECERLQGFPSVITKVAISLCIDHQNNCVHAEAKCLRSQSSVQLADANELMRNASTAAQHFSTRQVGREPLVALRVQLRSGDPAVQISSHGKLIWCASGAGAQGRFPHPTLGADIALLIAQQTLDLARETINGKVVSRLSATLSLADASGNICVRRSTDAIEDCACAAVNGQLGERFTTSSLGQLTPTCDSKLATLLCFALDATSGFIPSGTLNDSFSVEIEIESGHTDVLHNGKPAADGQRYKALGNSWAINCARWIGERIDAVDRIVGERE